MTELAHHHLVYEEKFEYDILGVEWRLYRHFETDEMYWVPMAYYPEFQHAKKANENE